MALSDRCFQLLVGALGQNRCNGLLGVHHRGPGLVRRQPPEACWALLPKAPPWVANRLGTMYWGQEQIC